jgi:hypothetical protein
MTVSEEVSLDGPGIDIERPSIGTGDEIYRDQRMNSSFRNAIDDGADGATEGKDSGSLVSANMDDGRADKCDRLSDERGIPDAGTRTARGVRFKKEKNFIEYFDKAFDGVDMHREGEKHPSEVYLGACVAALLDKALPPDIIWGTGSLTQRIWHAWRVYHDYFRMFGEENGADTRLMRWLRFVTMVLSCLFIDTLFYQQLFPDTGDVCESYTSEVECLKDESPLSTEATLCEWDKVDFTCTLHPPPTDAIFITVTTILIFAMSIILQFMLWFIFDNYACKRPRLEELGCVPDSWLGVGHFPHYPNEMKVGQETPLEKILKMKVSLADPQRIEKRKRVDVRMAYEDFTSAEEEASSIAVTVKRYFLRDLDALEAPVIMQSALDPTAAAELARREAKERAIASVLKLDVNGDPFPLSLWDRLKYKNAYTKLVKKLKRARKKARDIKDHLESLRHDEFDDDVLDSALLQHFTLEQFTGLKRYALVQQLFQYDALCPDSINPYLWIIVWIYIILSVLFYLYWAFAWGVSNGGKTLVAWGINFAMVIGYTLLVIHPVKVVISYVFTLEALRPQLRGIYRTLKNMATTVMQEDIFLDGEFRVVQHMSASCRAARSGIAVSLAASRILRHIDDVHVEHCRSERSTYMPTLTILILIIPVVVVSMGEAGQFVIDTLLCSTISALIIAGEELYNLGVHWLILFCVLVAAFLAFRFYVNYREVAAAAQDRENLLRERRASKMMRSSEDDIPALDKIEFERWHQPRRSTYKKRNVREYVMLPAKALYKVARWSYKKVLRVEYFRERKRVREQWRLLNLPRVCQGYVNRQCARAGMGSISSKARQYSRRLLEIAFNKEASDDDSDDDVIVDKNLYEGIPEAVRKMEYVMGTYRRMSAEHRVVDVVMKRSMFGIVSERELSALMASGSSKKSSISSSRNSSYDNNENVRSRESSYDGDADGSEKTPIVVFKYKSAPTSLRSIEFRDKNVTNSADVALRRILSQALRPDAATSVNSVVATLQGDSITADTNLETCIFEHKKVSEGALTAALRDVLPRFHPSGQPLTGADVEDIVDAFTIWVRSSQSHDNVGDEQSGQAAQAGELARAAEEVSVVHQHEVEVEDFRDWFVQNASNLCKNLPSAIISIDRASQGSVRP